MTAHTEKKPNGATTGAPPPNGSVPPPNPDIGDQANPFADLSQWRVTADFRTTGAVKKSATEIVVDKPGKQEFIWVHPSEEYRLDLAVIERETDRALFLVHPSLTEGLAKYTKLVTLYTVQNTQGVTYLWPVSVPAEGSSNSWVDSAHACARVAMRECIQLSRNRHPKANRYEPLRPVSNPPAPEWPDLSFSQLLHLAFGNRYITTLDHPVVQALRGETF